MVTIANKPRRPFKLVITGEAEGWLPALEKIVGHRLLAPCRVHGDADLLKVVEEGVADAAVLDDAADWEVDILRLLRMVRRLDAALPVVVITGKRDRRWLEDALRLAAFSVVARPLALEELLRQIQGMMARLDQVLREGPPW